MLTLSVSIFFNNYKWNNLLGYFIVLIGGLIYNELIIIYICGLEKNTKKEIQKRANYLEEEIGMIEDEKMFYLEKIKSILTLCEKKKKKTQNENVIKIYNSGSD